MQLPQKLPWPLANTKWAAILNPIIANPLLSGRIISNQLLKSGDNSIPHGLGTKITGYLIILNSTSATFYDKQASNQKPELFLILNSSNDTTVSLYVF